MFKPISSPKEGRSPPGLLYAGPPLTRKRLIHKQATITLIVLACFLMGCLVLNSEGNISPGSASVLLAGSDSRETLNGSNFHENATDFSERDQKSTYHSSEGPYLSDILGEKSLNPIKDLPDRKLVSQSSTEDARKTKQGVEEGGANNGKPINAKSNGKKLKADVSSLAPVREEWSDRPQLEQALAKVISLMPDEVHIRELTRPIEGSGKERMREMGLRTRAYKRYLEAWEALHLTVDAEGAAYIRDDVIQYLRGHQQGLQGSEFSEEEVGGMNLAQTVRSYEAYRSFLQKFANTLFPWTMPYFSDHMSLHAHFKKGGRGIVLTAGDGEAPYLLTTIWSFRKLGCTLPIEVMYLGDQDLNEDYRSELEALPGVITRDMAQMVVDDGWKLAGWAAKPFAILFSSFREVIFIDADSFFFRDPEILFDDSGYKKHGALFFRDRLMMPENKKRWLQQILPKPIPKLARESRMWTGESLHMQESGVVVVDKWKHFISMLLIARFNGPDRDGNKERGITGVYDIMYGDKETFWLGFLLAGDESYSFHGGDAGVLGETEHFKKELKMRENTPPPEEAKISESSPSSVENVENLPNETPVAFNGVLELQGPQNYTICAPQLLHLDTDGKPLWFNGWLVENKFVEESKRHFMKFKSYLIEAREVREPGQWQLGEDNMCCLTADADKKHDFDENELAILDMIMERAIEINRADRR